MLPYSPEDLAAKFVDQQVSSRALTSCALRYAMIKFPDNVIGTKLDWLNKSYVDLGVSNKTLHFKVRNIYDNHIDFLFLFTVGGMIFFCSGKNQLQICEAR